MTKELRPSFVWTEWSVRGAIREGADTVVWTCACKARPTGIIHWNTIAARNCAERELQRRRALQAVTG